MTTPNKTAHTPGPWEMIADQAACFHKGNRVSIIKHTSAEQAGEDCVETVAEIWPTSGDSDIADGRLIAAAPELLEALKKVQAFINDLSKSNPGFLGKLVLQDYAQYNDAMIKMPRAMAKAEGRAQ